ncbi:MAG: thymidylate synthase [Parcubacteria group bacterium]|nr:thymidylate synthase [Parcubacteria group bacterium]
MASFDEQYRDAIRRIMTEGDEVFSHRTGLATKAIPGMVFESRPEDGFPLLTLRKIPIRIFVAEMVWFLMGSNRPDEFVRTYTKIWDDFTHEDGTVPAAYGYRWRKHFGRDQLGLLIKHLQDEPTSRQGVVIYWDPADDSLGSPNKKLNVPCPYTFTANITGGKLNLTVTSRSTDMMLGLPHDVAGHALLQYVLAQKLKIIPGKLTFLTSHAHIYSNHYNQAWEITERVAVHAPVQIHLPNNAFERSERGDHGLVQEILEQIIPQYKPQPPLAKMQIAVGQAH